MNAISSGEEAAKGKGRESSLEAAVDGGAPPPLASEPLGLSSRAGGLRAYLGRRKAS